MKKQGFCIEAIYLKIFKGTVLTVMSIALIGVILMLGSAAINFTVSPKEPAPAKTTIKREVTIDDLKKTLIEENSKKASEPETPVNTPATENHRPLLYKEEATTLHQCSVNFGKSINVAVPETSAEKTAQEIETLRSQLEQLAAESESRGAAYVKSAVLFTCKVTTDVSIIDLKKTGKIGSVFIPTLNFHLTAWDKIQKEAAALESEEHARVSREREEDNIRVTSAHTKAITQITSAGVSFLAFMILAIYLLGARIENHLNSLQISAQKLLEEKNTES